MRRLSSDDRVVDPAIVGDLVQEYSAAAERYNAARTEMEEARAERDSVVRAFVVAGLTQREIAEELEEQPGRIAQMLTADRLREWRRGAS